MATPSAPRRLTIATRESALALWQGWHDKIGRAERKLVTELGLDYRNVGLFVRGSALYDFDVMGGNTARTPLATAAAGYS